eukprot:CAMPEP_0197029166 /NCGR_PEP_ID=MMETSP1384-20130603/8664_1 /TAXON_ID=29189 /ORGANISM="Ammonia sp." /LENGTH=496 /DNA_ID=CAMNT_0042458277 /DNA_START=18 /DNA_END=1508 /DNA_ORIENTATION=+
MGCGSSTDPLLDDIYDTFEQQYDFELIFPNDPAAVSTKTLNDAPSSPSASSFELINVDDHEIDVNNNSSGLSESSEPIDILIDLNEKISKLIIRLTQYNGAELQPVVKLGMNESKLSPQRGVTASTRDDAYEHEEEKADLIMIDNNGLIHMELIISFFIRDCHLNVKQLCPQKFFPNDIKAMMISFYSHQHPKVQAFRVLVSTATLCRNTLNLCQYLGVMLSRKLLFQDKLNDIQHINQQSIITQENAAICRQLIFLFHYILALDQYKMPKQQPLTNNFTAYKRMHSDFVNRQSYGGGGFASFKNKSGNQGKDELSEHNLTEKELLPIDELTNIAMFMGNGSTACIDAICDGMAFDADSPEVQILSEFANGCLTLLRANGNNKPNRKSKVVQHSLFILRAMVAVLLILDTKKSASNAFNSVFGGNENKVKTVECMRVMTTQFLQWYGDNDSIQMMQGVNDKHEIEYHIKYCKRIVKFGAKGFKSGNVKRSIENMLD